VKGSQLRVETDDTRPKKSKLDPVRESEVKVELGWKADERTQKAFEHQAKLMGFDTPTNYLHEALASVIAGNEEYTIVATRRPDS
jgi:hypothetical protein